MGHGRRDPDPGDTASQRNETTINGSFQFLLEWPYHRENASSRWKPNILGGRVTNSRYLMNALPFAAACFILPVNIKVMTVITEIEGNMMYNIYIQEKHVYNGYNTVLQYIHILHDNRFITIYTDIILFA